MSASITSKTFLAILVSIAFCAAGMSASAQGGKAESRRITVGEKETIVQGRLANGQEME